MATPALCTGHKGLASSVKRDGTRVVGRKEEEKFAKRDERRRRGRQEREGTTPGQNSKKRKTKAR